MSYKKKGDYEVGYGKPPKKHQFKKGQSGNPKGRKKNSKNTLEILKNELNQKVSLTENGKEVVLTKRQAMLKHMGNKAVKGEMKAMMFVYSQLLTIDVSEKERKEIMDDLSKNDEDILKRYLYENIQAEKLDRGENARENNQ